MSRQGKRRVQRKRGRQLYGVRGLVRYFAYSGELEKEGGTALIPDKATTERNARVLRELVKQPDNKSCSDCRKNGIHRSMGTHISKVKSIDLDIWTPEQMEKWGNRRANAYWEKHLKKGHVPPEHKIESFIRSKYESRRWAMEGPLPRDPSVLDEDSEGAVHQPAPTSTTTAAPPAPAPLPRSHPLLSRQAAAAPKATPAAAASTAPLFDLMGGDDPAPAPTAAPTRAPATTSAPPAPAATTAAAAPGPTAPPAPASTAAPGSNIFDLDFRAPTPSSKPQTAKADIMSLFSNSTSPPATSTNSGFFNATPATPLAPQNNFGSWQGGITSSAPPAAPIAHQTSTAGWGGLQMDQGGWGAPVSAAAPAAQQSQQVQSVQPQRQASFGSNAWGAADPWAAQPAPAMNGGMGGGGQKKDDPFANIWQ